jgi:type VI protein secretion system component VasK
MPVVLLFAIGWFVGPLLVFLGYSLGEPGNPVALAMETLGVVMFLGSVGMRWRHRPSGLTPAERREIEAEVAAEKMKLEEGDARREEASRATWRVKMFVISVAVAVIAVAAYFQ